MSIHKTLLAILVSLLFAPAATSFAAFDDVTLATDVVIGLDSFDLRVSGSSAAVESIVVDGDSLDVSLQSGSSITIDSTDKRVFKVTSSSGAFTQAPNCTENKSSITITGTGPATVTVVPSSSTCAVSRTGGGSGVPGMPVATPPSATPDEQGSNDEREGADEVADEGGAEGLEGETASPDPARKPVSVPPTAFSQTLRPGVAQDSVRTLQRLLNSDPDTRLAAEGPGSPGNETDYFGPLTEDAVRRFQEKYGIVSFGTPKTTGYGLVGPRTRAMLQAVFGGGAVSDLSGVGTGIAPTPRSPTAFSQTLRPGVAQDSVRTLQRLLNSDPDTRLAAEGPGSPGNETDYFGPLTEDAVRRFQEKYGIVSFGTPKTTGYGLVGPRTRAMLQAVFGD